MKLKTSQLCLDAMLAAMCAVLGYISIDMGNIKITAESFPVILSGLMYGPLDGALTAGIGTFIYQILKYGFSATTFLWILPYVLCGIFCGLCAKKADYFNSRRQLVLISAVSELMMFIINTGVLYLDSKIYGYYSPVYIFGSLGTRFIIAIIKAVLFGIILPHILKALAPVTRNGYGTKRKNR